MVLVASGCQLACLALRPSSATPLPPAFVSNMSAATPGFSCCCCYNAHNLRVKFFQQLLFNTTRTHSGPPSTGATITMDGVFPAAAVQHNARARTHSGPPSTGVAIVFSDFYQDDAKSCADADSTSSTPAIAGALAASTTQAETSRTITTAAIATAALTSASFSSAAAFSF